LLYLKEFDQNKNLKYGSPELNSVLDRANAKLLALSHPDDYVSPYMPGGSKFMRNNPMPLEYQYPDGIPEGVDQRTVNFDQTPYRKEDPPFNFVDFANKKYF